MSDREHVLEARIRNLEHERLDLQRKIERLERNLAVAMGSKVLIAVHQDTPVGELTDCGIIGGIRLKSQDEVESGT